MRVSSWIICLSFLPEFVIHIFVYESIPYKLSPSLLHTLLLLLPHTSLTTYTLPPSLTQEIRSVVDDSVGEVMDPKGPDVVRFGFEESEVALVLHLHLLDVALRCPSHGALHVEHAQKTGALGEVGQIRGMKWKETFM